jgi:ribose-phosphate pyrophosphokinase
LAVKHDSTVEVHLYVPYVLGARSDRQFSDGENNYLRDVICPIINLQGFKSVTVLDPHSDVLEACLNGFKKVSNKELVGFAIHDIYTTMEIGGHLRSVIWEKFYNNAVLVSPDAGASKKIYKIAEQIGYKGDIITCSKERDENGKLTRCVLPNIYGDQWKKDFIIIDDIADGAGTFINIAKLIKGRCPMEYKLPKIYLIVTHGIFSKGFEELSKYFDGIYCTNSYQSMDYYPSHPEWSLKLVKQLDIFK